MKNDKINKTYLFLVLLTILALPLYLIRFSIGPIPTTILELMIYASFIVGLASHQIKIKSNVLFYSLVVFVIAGFVSVIFDPNIVRAAGLWKAYFFDGFLIYLIVSSFDKDQKNKAFLALCVSGAITATIALISFFFGVRSQDGRLLDLDRLSPNYLSMFLVPTLTGSVFFTISYFKDRGRFVYFLSCSVLIATALILSGSRGAYLALPAGLLTMLLVFVKQQRRKTYAIYVAIACALIILGGIWMFRPSFGDMGRTGSSSNIRYYIWKTSGEIIVQKPILGVGLSNFQDYFTNLTMGRVNYTEFIAPQALTAHNLYLHIYLTMGILGIASFLAILWFSLIKSKNIVIIAAVISILVYGLVDTPFFRNDLAGMFWILIALL